MKRAVSLLRVSSDGQTRRAGAEEGYSIDVQREGSRHKAEALGAELIREFVGPAQSASRGFYPALRDALDFIQQSGDIDYLIVYRLDRLARDELTQFAALAELKRAGTQLVSVTEQIDETPQGMLAMGILGAVNAYRSRDDARKITEGRVKKAKLGGMPSRAPIGYLNVRQWEGANDIRTVKVDPDRAPHVQWAFQAYASGEWSLRALAEALEERGLRTVGTPKFPSRPLNNSGLQRILTNPFYRGIVRFKGVEYAGTHEPLVTPELFEEVQQRLTAKNLGGDRHWKHEHYLKGTVYCSLCGSRLVFTKCTGRRGGRYDYYVCGKRHRGDKCDLPYLPADRVEKVVADYYVRQVTLDAERVAKLEPDLVRMFRRLTGYRQRELVRARKRVQDLLAQRRRLVEGHLTRPEAIPLEVLEEKQADLGARLEAATREVATAEREIEGAEKGLDLARQLLESATTTYSQADSDLRRRWNQVFFKKIYLATDEAAGAELTDSFGALLATDLPRKVRALKAKPQALRARGSNVAYLVEPAGLEPAPSALQTPRSPN